MKDSFYHFMARTLGPILWGGSLVGEENLPDHGPAVFVANHLDLLGPIAVCGSLPLRLYPWLQAEMLDHQEAVAYMQWDVFERQLHLKLPVSRWLSRVICVIAVPFLRSLGCIPVYKHDYDRLRITFSSTVDILREGKYVLIFPEGDQPPAVADPVTKMYPFRRSFVRLGEFYFKATGESLQFYPLAVHPSGFVEVGKPAVYNNHPGGTGELNRIKDIMEQEIRAMVLKMDAARGNSKRSWLNEKPALSVGNIRCHPARTRIQAQSNLDGNQTG